MICRSCLRQATALGRQSTIPKAPIRRTFLSATTPRQAAAAAAAAAAPADRVPAASDAPASGGGAPALSSCPAGTVLNGLNYFKGKTDPVALPDDEYPEWLWSCLDVQKKADAEEDADAGDEFCTCLPEQPSLTWPFPLLEVPELVRTNGLAPPQPSPRNSEG